MVKSVKASKTSDKKVQGAKKSLPKKVIKPVGAVEKSAVATSKKYTNMFAAYRAFWQRGFTDWMGTSSRSEYWLAALANTLIVCGMLVLMWITSMNGISNGFEAFAGVILLGVLALYGLASVVPSVSMVVRRLRDGGFSPLWALLFPMSVCVPYIDYVATVILFIFMLMPTCVNGKNNK